MTESGIFSGTFLDEVVKLATANKFDTLELGPIEDGEEIIGEMTTLEKAIFARSHQIADELKNFCEGCDHSPEDVDGEKCKRGHVLAKQAEPIREIGWRLIEERLNKHDCKLGVRADFQIVKIPEQQRRRGGMGVTIIGIDIGGRRG